MSHPEDPTQRSPAAGDSRPPSPSQFRSDTQPSANNTDEAVRQNPSAVSGPANATPLAAKPPHRNPPPSRRKNHSIGAGKQITRSRVSYSCHTCRRRKVKCDKIHPVCSNCAKTGSQCVYDSRSVQQQRPSDETQHGTKRRRELHRLADVPLAELLSAHGALPEPSSEHDAQQRAGGSGEIAARLDRLTSIVERLSQTQPPLDDDDNNSTNGQGLSTGHDSPNTKPILSDPGTAGSSNGSSTVSRRTSGRSSPKRQSDQAANEDFPIPSGLETDLVDPVGTLNLGHLSLDECGKSRYVGTTYWAYISDEINELNQLLRDQNRSQEQSSPSQPDDVNLSFKDDNNPGLSSPKRPFEPSEPWPTHDETVQRSVLSTEDSPSSSSTAIQPEILDHMPTRRQSNILYKGFMSGVQAISPVIHPPTILSQYQAFWEWYDYRGYAGEPCPKPSFIPLLYAIWYGGSVTISLRTIHAEFHVETRSTLSGPFHDQVTRWLKKISFPRNASLYSLAAFLLVQTILSKEEEPLTSSLFVSLALRVAQTMGLHRDPAQFGIPACEAETRRRLWWHIVHMDGVVAMSSGLPPQVSDENYWDVRVTTDVKDTLIGTRRAVEYERLVEELSRKPDRPDDPNVCGSSMVNVHYISAKGKYAMAQAIRKILKIQLGTKPVTRKDMEDLRTILIDLSAKLRALVARIPIPKPSSLASRDGQRDTAYPATDITFVTPDLSNGGPGCGEQYHTPVLAAFHKWARILLSLFVHKAFCVAYQPFLKNAKSKIWPSARQCALRHCHGFMEKFILLATDPDFQPFQWSWPGNHQPMHATMIMLIDLYERPNSPEAPKSRAFIDRIFSLSGPDGGVVGGEDGVSTSRPLKDGGREAWDMMRRLREKAWQKAGLDPKVLWTEQAQAQAGVSQTTSTPPARAGSSDKTRAPTSFADSYYSLIKESGDGHTPSRQPTAENQLKDPPRRIYNDGPYQHPSTGPAWLNTSDPHAVPTKPGAQFMPSPTLFQTPPLQSFPLPSGSHYSEETPGFFGTASTDDRKTRPYPNPTFAVNPNTSTTTTGNNKPLSTSTVSQTANQNFLRHNNHHHSHLPDFPQANTVTEPGPMESSANVNFDWDQWNAVFGEYLPVVDGFMDLDTSPMDANPNYAHASSQQQSQLGRNDGSSGPMAGADGMSEIMMGDDMGFDYDFGVGDTSGMNWADFG